jgi:hypothetical protein
MAELDIEIAAFEARREELEEHHMGKWVIFYGEDLVDSFDTLDNAAEEARKRFGHGPFLIRQVGAPAFALPASVMFRPVYSDADH